MQDCRGGPQVGVRKWAPVLAGLRLVQAGLRSLSRCLLSTSAVRHHVGTKALPLCFLDSSSRGTIMTLLVHAPQHIRQGEGYQGGGAQSRGR